MTETALLSPEVAALLEETLGAHVDAPAPLLDSIRGAAQDCIEIYLIVPEASHTVGGSRLGGLSDAPAGWSWPRDEVSPDYRLEFLGQLNLADLPSVKSGTLPRRGLLSFFAAMGGPAYNLDHQVFLFDEGTALERCAPPPDSERCHDFQDQECCFIHWLVRPRAAPSIDWAAPAPEGSDAYDLAQAAESAGMAPYRLLCPGGWHWQTGLGNAQLFVVISELITPLRLEAWLCRIGRPDMIHRVYRDFFDKTVDEIRADIARLEKSGHGGSPDCRRLQNYLKLRDEWEPRIAEFEREAGSWRMLFSLESNAKLDMCFWDSGAMQFVAHREDLARGDFGKTYCCIETT